MNVELFGKTIELSKQDFLDAKKRFFDPETAEGKEIEMAMTVDTSAEYATNAQEYFRRAMIGEESTRSKFRPLLGIKDRVKLGTVSTTALQIKPGATNPSFDNTEASQKEFEVKWLMVATDINIRELEIAFMSDQLAKGSNNFSDKFAFMNFFYESVEKEIEELMEIATFQGTVAANGFDGLETLMAADAAVLKPTSGNGGVASAVTDANVIAKLKQARNVSPRAVRRLKDFVYIVSGNVYDALADAVAENKVSGLYFVENVNLTFQGTPIYKADGASNNVIIAGAWSNLLNIQDLQDEELGFNIVDFMKTGLIRKIGMRVDFKFQPSYLLAEEIYFHKP